MKNVFVLFLGAFFALTGYAQTLNEAKKLTENEQYDAATAIYKITISREPSNGTNYYYFGENLLLSENPDSAQIIFEQGRKIDPNNFLLKIGMVKILLNSVSVLETKSLSDKDPANTQLKAHYEAAKDQVAQATALLEATVTEAGTKNSQVFIEAADALIHFKNKNLDRAKQLLDKAFIIEPKNPDIQILFGDIYTELNNGTLAADYYNKALDLDKTSAHAIVNKGRLYKRSTNYDGAAAEFENAIKTDSNYAPAYRELGETNFKLKKLEKAKENYRKYLELSKNNCGARIRYASFLYISKDFNGALNELNQVRQKCDSNNLTLLRVFSYCYFETKDYNKGLETVNRLFIRLPEEKRIAKDYEYYGKLLVAGGQDSLGIIQLRKAYALEPERTDLLSEIATSCYNQKHYTDAIDVLVQKVNIGKDVNFADYVILGRSYYFNSQFFEADTAYAKVNELNAKFASAWLGRANTNTHIDSTSELGLAKPFFEKYIELAREDSVNSSKYQQGLIAAYGYLAYYYILKNDTANALMFLEKKIELPLEPEEKKKVQDAIDQLKGRKPKKQ